MPRPLRIHVPGGFYHVTLRGNHRQKLFFRAEDHARLEIIVAEVTARLGDDAFAKRILGGDWQPSARQDLDDSAVTNRPFVRRWPATRRPPRRDICESATPAP